MNLKEYAQAELERAGLFDDDADYGGMLGEAVMELVEVFAKQGHSGYSAQITLRIFTDVASFRPLTPLTNDPAEWMKVSNDEPMWQSRRNPSVFSNDGGETWYDINDKEGASK